MPTILQWCDRDSLKIEAGATIYAGVRENFKDVKGGHKCKLCGEVVSHPRAAAAHLAVHHKGALESEVDLVNGHTKMTAGGPGSGRHSESGDWKKSGYGKGGATQSKSDEKDWKRSGYGNWAK